MSRNFSLSLNAFEIGVLYGMFNKEKRNNPDLPRALELKLQILSTRCYLGHPVHGTQARKDIKKLKSELLELERKGS